MRSSLAETSAVSPASPIEADASHRAPSVDPVPRDPIAADASPGASRHSFDAAGITLVVICAIHCVATPMIALLPIGSLFASSALEWLLPTGAVLFALAVIGVDYRAVHGRRAPLALLAVAALLTAAAHTMHDTGAGTAIALVGSGCLALALLLNVRLRRKFRACCTRHVLSRHPPR